MAQPIIRVDHVTKEFRLGQLTGLRQSLRNGANRLLGRPVARPEAFKALDDVSFSIEAGEVVGIIGHNGAGKSTMLKLLASISQPTQGTVRVAGRVAPLIEVGAGLVPDMTGRENVFLNGAILGMRHDEIRRKFDDIVGFAELERFIDTPVKRYSSGMQVRLGFSIATAVRAQILIVDEVLAVGDLAFQRKCFERVRSIIDDGGTTVLVVSHNLRQIERLCGRALLMTRGRVVMDGPSSKVCDAFYDQMNRASGQTATSVVARFVGSDEIDLQSVSILDENGDEADEITSGESLRIRVRFVLKAPVDACEFHIGTHTTDFFYLTGASSAAAGIAPDLAPGTYEVIQHLESYSLKLGNYCVRFALIDGNGRVVFNGENLKVFRVRAASSEAYQDELRIFDVPTNWSVAPVSMVSQDLG